MRILNNYTAAPSIGGSGVCILTGTFTMNSPETAGSIHSNTVDTGSTRPNVSRTSNGTINGTAGATAGW